VDLQRLMAEYYKAQEAARQFKEKEASFLKELDGLRLEGRKIAAEAETMRRVALDDASSAIEKAEKKKGFELKLLDLQAFELNYQGTKNRKETELQVFITQSNKRIVEDVMSATRNVGEKEGFNLILNASRANPVASDVLFAKQVEDVTEKILTLLNAGKPPAKETSAEKAKVQDGQ